MYDFALVGLTVVLCIVCGVFIGMVKDNQHVQEIECYKVYEQQKNQKKCLDIVKQ